MTVIRHRSPSRLAVAVTALLFAAGAAGEPVDAVEGPAYFDRATQAVIEEAIESLAESQRQDGSFGEKNPAAITALSMIGFMVNGHVPGQGRYGDAIDNGIDYLLEVQDENGYMGSSMYEHGLATLALSEVWGMSEKDDKVKDALKKAVQLIFHAQNEVGGWRYLPRPQDDDVSVTAMQVVALASAQQAGILVPDEVIEKAIQYLRMCFDPATGGFNYQPRPYSAAAFPRTAAAVTALMMCGEYDSKEVNAGVKYLRAEPDEKFAKVGHYAYAHYYAIQVMHRSGEDVFSQWYPKIRDAWSAKLKGEGRKKPSAYNTAMAVIVLGAPCRFVPAYQR